MRIGITIVRSEAIGFHRRWFPERTADYGKDVADSLAAGLAIPAAEYVAARAARRRLSRTVRAALDGGALLAGPTVPLVAFENRVAWQPSGPGGELPRHGLTRLTYPLSLSRLPAITVPCGLARGVPVGLQVGGLEPAGVLAAAGAYERARGPWPSPPARVA
jgi:aspartyl-tRNA(Asn)/glutamyl-tRNA(Gln) amidotransferase subunit A